MIKMNASEDFKEKHLTHRGIPGGNQVDGLPTELRIIKNGSKKRSFQSGSNNSGDIPN